MRSIDLSIATWRKSTHSNQDGGACIEVADNLPARVPVRVRDSKDPYGPTLLFESVAWSSFITTVKRGQLPNA